MTTYITREEAHTQCLSRDCHCVNGKDRDSNYHEIIDKVFDYFEAELEKSESRTLKSECERGIWERMYINEMTKR